VTVELVVDTGFTGVLTLPPDAVADMRLPFVYDVSAQLADGSFIDIAAHSGTILWNGSELPVRILSTGTRPLLGTSLLDGYELLAQFREEGVVTVDGL
jgi:clan AA aspartic protease